MTKVIIEKVNTDSAMIIGKTYDSVTFSGDKNSREKIKGQTFITTDPVDDSMTVRGEGHDSIIRTVEAKDKVEVSVNLLNAENIEDGSSLASVILRNVWTAKGVENPDMTEVFVMDGTNEDALSEILNLSRLMRETPTGKRALGKWYPAVNGKRVIIRCIDKINKSGAIDRSSPCDCGDCCEDED